ncbi:hypothetical protein RhiXN_11405 [Rhizoctonia solani]|uniref:Uncharacterized protein n=1 Tax=Rhizoctonia solani TaxID=456999 RepID=A0A8H8T1H8_9AGAM|nr:uncharacterized protein RhiXN_11405 [Rhizoctonia solani]QRW24493.1 hypothetical protein RhiXN_11405 [Rhizoctonia solani]
MLLLAGLTTILTPTHTGITIVCITTICIATHTTPILALRTRTISKEMNRTATTTHLILEAAGIMEEDTIIPASMDPILGIIGTVTIIITICITRLPLPRSKQRVRSYLATARLPSHSRLEVITITCEEDQVECIIGHTTCILDPMAGTGATLVGECHTNEEAIKDTGIAKVELIVRVRLKKGAAATK